MPSLPLCPSLSRSHSHTLTLTHSHSLSLTLTHSHSLSLITHPLFYISSLSHTTLLSQSKTRISQQTLFISSHLLALQPSKGEMAFLCRDRVPDKRLFSQKQQQQHTSLVYLLGILAATSPFQSRPLFLLMLYYHLSLSLSLSLSLATLLLLLLLLLQLHVSLSVAWLPVSCITE